MIDIIKILGFSFFVNWSISLQILNQAALSGKEKKIAAGLAIVFGIVAGSLVIL